MILNSSAWNSVWKQSPEKTMVNIFRNELMGVLEFKQEIPGFTLDWVRWAQLRLIAPSILKLHNFLTNFSNRYSLFYSTSQLCIRAAPVNQNIPRVPFFPFKEIKKCLVIASWCWFRHISKGLKSLAIPASGKGLRSEFRTTGATH